MTDGGLLEVRAPGRVNLIGEHIDYAGLAVLPMAIGRAVRLRVRPRSDDEVRVATEAEGLEPRSFRVEPEAEPFPQGDWGNYPLAAVQAVARHLGSDPPLRGFEAQVSSDLPAAAGLGSSSALTVACGLALLAVNGREVPPLELAEALAEGERTAGLRGGGMDQAVCLAAREGTAAHIAFSPLAVRHVPVPADWRFVVAHSLVPARKAEDARETYNRRTEEVAEALRIVARGVGPGAPAESYVHLRAAAVTPRLMAAAEERLGRSLLGRFRHVVTEADRVDGALRALRAADLDAFGRLLTASHASLRDDFEVSHPALDELVEICLSAGAVGARLTGAGLGGSVLAVCARDRAPRLMRTLVERFYEPRMQDADAALGRHLFAARSTDGAAVTGPPLR